jgi:protoheme ferro-lyase
MTVRKKIGVVLFQLGGPDSLDAVKPFLYNLFCDRHYRVSLRLAGAEAAGVVDCPPAR